MAAEDLGSGLRTASAHVRLNVPHTRSQGAQGQPTICPLGQQADRPPAPPLPQGHVEVHLLAPTQDRQPDAVMRPVVESQMGQKLRFRQE